MLRLPRRILVLVATFAALILGAARAGATTFVGGSITSNTTWTTANSPYEVTSEVVVYNSATLTIDPGVTVNFNSGTGIVVGYYVYDYCAVNCVERGSLKVNGTAASPVLFTAKSGASGGWKGVAFGNATDYGGTSSSLKYLTIDKAGQGQTLAGTIGSTSAGLMMFTTGVGFTFDHVSITSSSGYGAYVNGSTFSSTASTFQSNASNGLYSTGSSITLPGALVKQNGGAGIYLASSSGSITSSTIQNNTTYGIDLSSSSPTISGNTLSSNGSYAIRYPISTAPSISGNTLSSNTNPGIEVTGGSLTSNHTWDLQSGETTFTITGSEIVVYNSAKLTVKAGVTAKFASSTGLVIGYYVYDYCAANCVERGSLDVQGTQAAPVLFTPTSGAAGGWRGVAFGNATDYGGTASSMTYLTIEKAGQAQTLAGTVGSTSANLMMFNAGVGFTSTSVTLQGSSSYGAYVNGSTFTTTGLKSTGNAANGVYSTGSAVTLTSGTVTSNTGAGVYMTGSSGTISGSTISSNTTYGIDMTGSTTTISNNTISSNGSYAIRYTVTNAPSISGNTLSGNTNPGIEVTGGALTANHTWNLQSGETSFTITGAEIVVYNSATLTVAAGVTAKFASSTGLVIGYYVYDYCAVNCVERGSLTVNGTAQSPVLFTAQSGSAGGWRGVAFGNATDYGGTKSTLSYLTVEKAGQAQTLAGTVGSTTANVMLFNTGVGFGWTGVQANTGSGYGIYTYTSTLNAWSGGGGAGNSNYDLIMVGGSSGSISSATFGTSSTGGAYIDGSSPTFTSTTFTGNLGVGLYLRAGSVVSVTNGTFSSNRSQAIYTEDLASVATISGNTVSNNGRGADGLAGTGDDTFTMRVSAQSPVSTNSFSGNGKQGIEMVGGAITTNRSWKLPGTGDYQPYVLLTETVIYNAATLTVDAGVTVQFASNTGLIIGYYVYDYCAVNCVERGALTVNGTVSAPVLFTAQSGAAGGWRGLAFGNATDYGGTKSTLAYLTVEKAGQAQTLAGTIGSTSADIMYFNTGVGFTQTEVSANGSSGYGFYVNTSQITATGGGAQTNTLDGVYATGSTFSLSAGQVIQNGQVGIRFTSTGGTIQTSTIRGNGSYGIDLVSGSPTITLNRIKNNGSYAIRYPIAQAPTITFNTLTNNTQSGIEVTGGGLTSNHTWARQTGEAFFTLTGSEAVVYNSATLSVDGGVTVRFASNTGLVIGYYVYDYCAVNCVERGSIKVNGTMTLPVLFTSKSGTVGDWRGVAFGNATDYGGTTSKLDYLIVEKGGQAQTLAGTVGSTSANIMMFSTSQPTMRHVVSARSSVYGIYANASSPVVQNSIVAYNTNSGLVSTFGGSPSFTYGDVFGNGAGNSGWTASTGSLTVDPSFTSYTTGDYRLNVGSGVIDKGVVISGYTYVGAAPDMGALEYGATVSGNCSDPFVSVGTPCDDGSACTAGDACQSGQCIGYANSSCSPGDQCNNAAVCDAESGACVGTQKANGTACSDGSVCTQTDACQSGVCTGTNPVACGNPGTCKVAAGCDPVQGCLTANAANGSSCSDSNACTGGDACQSGACVSGTPTVCPGAGACTNAGTCDPTSGACSASTPKPNGTSCSDGNACTVTDSCQSGSCASGSPVTCAASDQCHSAGTCDPASGACSNPAAANGTACNDGNLCTQSDSCQSGSCSGASPVVCTAQDACHDAGTCNPQTGTCSNPLGSDQDGDGDADACDNCVAVANADQADADGDGVGDACPFVKVTFTILHADCGGTAFDLSINGNVVATAPASVTTCACNAAPLVYDITDPFDLASLTGNGCDVFSVALSQGGANAMLGYVSVAVETADGGVTSSCLFDGSTANAAPTCAARDLCAAPGSSTNVASVTTANAIPCSLDGDNDGINDALDNCPTTPNANQVDSDADGLGDVCDACPGDVDVDFDGACDAQDVCVGVYDPAQSDCDSNGIGDACSADVDADGLPDACDNCPASANANQAETDGDGVGDACDNCPVDVNPNQADANGNGIGDVCDIHCVTITRSGNLTTVADTYITFDPTDPTKASATFGSSNILQVGTLGTATRRTLLRFDLAAVPASTTILSATLSLRKAQATGPTAVNVHRILAPWVESTVSWSSFADAFDPTVLASFQPLLAGNYATVDITSLVQLWLSGGAPNEGLLLDQVGGGRSIYGASDTYNTPLRPKLDVCY